MIPKSMPLRKRGWIPVFGKGLPPRTRRSCSTNSVERDDDSKISHPALAAYLLRRHAHRGILRRRPDELDQLGFVDRLLLQEALGAAVEHVAPLLEDASRAL